MILADGILTQLKKIPLEMTPWSKGIHLAYKKVLSTSLWSQDNMTVKFCMGGIKEKVMYFETTTRSLKSSSSWYQDFTNK